MKILGLSVWFFLLFSLIGCGTSARYSGSEFELRNEAVIYSIKGNLFSSDLAGKSQNLHIKASNPSFFNGSSEFLAVRDRELLSVDLSTGSSRSIRSFPLETTVAFPRFNERTKRIVFAHSKKQRGYSFGGNVSTSWDIWSCRVDGKDLKQHTTISFDWINLSSQCFLGDRVYFTASKLQDGPDVFSANIGSSPGIRKETADGNIWHASITPSGKMRAIVRGNGNYELVVSDESWSGGNLLRYGNTYFSGSSPVIMELEQTVYIIEDRARAQEFELRAIRLDDDTVKTCFSYR